MLKRRWWWSEEEKNFSQRGEKVRLELVRKRKAILGVAERWEVVFRYKGDGSSELVRGEVVAVVRV